MDLHLHSRASTDTGNWFLSRALLPESFTDPERAYRAAKRRGMDFVTLSDHNTIRGALEIAHHDDVFVSVEATVLFPEDRIPLHVLCWGVDEASWGEIDLLRPNVYELVAFLQGEGIAHALAHPLQRVGARLTAEHLEKCLLLFSVWEGRNGARTATGNEMSVRIARSASPAYMEKLADKHGIPPQGRPGPRAIVGGSDDHGLLDVAGTWTETPPARSVAHLLDHLRAGRTQAFGSHGSTRSLAHAMAGLALKADAEREAPMMPPALRGPLGSLLDHPLDGAAGSETPDPVGREVMRKLKTDPRILSGYRRLSRMPEGPDRSHAGLRLLAGWGHEQLLGLALSGAVARSGPLLPGLGNRVGWLVGAAAMVAPYLAAAGYHAAETRFAEEMAAEFFGAPAASPGPARVAVFTDTFDELNGVAGTLRRLAARSAETGAATTVVTCRERGGEEPGLVAVKPLAWFPVPAYRDRRWRLGVPPILDLLELMESRRIEVVHAATPGPMGIAALVLARVLGLPFVVSYHTEIGQYAQELTGDRIAAEIAGAWSGWFHRQATRVYVPSRATAVGLVDQGVDPDRLAHFGRGVDPVRFGPERRSRSWRRRLGGADERTVILSVGRISREKGLLDLAAAYRALAARRDDVMLAVVGEGPAEAELSAALAGTPHRMLGPLTGDALAAAYASADVFCLPSSTETLGQVVLEAAASGLPAVVIAGTAAAEAVEDGSTGIHVRRGDHDALAAALGMLASDPPSTRRMGLAARAAMLDRAGWDEVLDGLLADYDSLRRRPRERMDVALGGKVA